MFIEIAHLQFFTTYLLSFELYYIFISLILNKQVQHIQIRFDTMQFRQIYSKLHFKKTMTCIIETLLKHQIF